MSKQISKFLQERIDAHDFPSAVYLVAEKGEILMHEALGHAVVEPELIEARKDTIYDLASLTKVLVTGLLAASQIEDGDVTLESRLGDEVFGLDDSPVADLTIRDLATHTSGLPAWLPLYLTANSASPKDVAAVIGMQGLSPGKVEYSDLNFISLALAIEGPRPDSEFQLWVATTLGLKRTAFNPLSCGLARSDIAASEKGNGFERQTCIEKGYLQPPTTAGGSDRFRTETIWGEVHDNNAYFMGGVAGHAGLFSTAEEVFKIAQQFLPNYTTLLKPETCELFRKNFTSGMNEHRSFAFQLASTSETAAGTKMS